MKTLFAYIARLIVLSIVLLVFFGSAPLFYTVVPFWCLFHPSPYFCSRDMATVVMLTGPFACGFWMTVICHWHTVRKAQSEGRIDRWRETEGGMVCTVGKSIGFMVMGWFGSALAELIFSLVSRPLLWTFTGRLAFFAMAPFAVFAPVWIVLLRRWMRGRKQVDFSGAKGDRELRETLHAISLQAKSMRSQNAH